MKGRHCKEKKTHAPAKPLTPARTRWRLVGRIAAGLGMALGVLLTAALALGFGGLMLLYHGPSPLARDAFVTTAMETSFGKFVVELTLDKAVIQQIQARNAVVDTGAQTDTNLIDIPKQDEDKPLDAQKDIEIVDVVGKTYKGKLMMVRDPARVSVATATQLGVKGMRPDAIIRREKAIGGINGGGFDDPQGMSDGGIPQGFVFSGGKLVYGSDGTRGQIVGFTQKNVLVVGTMTAGRAKELGVRDAVCFGPALVVNGEPSAAVGSGGGMNPRTAIGQRKDGTVLLLVIDGRQSSSLGASHRDLIHLMVEYGAYNAANLDGGSSTVMVYEDKIINQCVSIYGPRLMPTAFIVK